MATNAPCFILCIEPVGEICQLLKMMLPDQQLHVQHVVSIQAAMKYLEAQQPALVILDNVFACHEASAHIAAFKRKAPNARILMISAVEEEAETAQSAGVDRFLAKPFTKATFTEAVMMMLK